MTDYLSEVYAECLECEQRFPCPAVARCPSCGGDQVRRVDSRVGVYESAPYETPDTVEAFEIGYGAGRARAQALAQEPKP